MGHYKIPTEATKENRKIFYGLHRKQDEAIKPWFDRVNIQYHRCEYPKSYKYFKLDKFLCELTNAEIESIRPATANKKFSIEQWIETLYNQNKCKIVRVSDGESVDLIQEGLPLPNMVKFERTVCTL